MKKNPKLIISYVVLVAIITVTLNIGVFQNPNFNIHDFCMNLASELIGLTIALTVVEVYIREKKK